MNNQMNKHIYLILLDWSTTDSDGIETYLYHDYKAARKKFNALIKDECNADTSWVGSEVFDENGRVNKDYELDCNTDDKNAHELYWRVVDRNDYNRHTFIDLFKREIL